MNRRLLTLAFVLVLGCDDDPRLDAGIGADAGARLDGGSARVDAGTGGMDGGLGSDAGAGDAGDGTPDAGAPDAGPPDPAVCPVGDADGCCPLEMRYGGSDPDCASLACANATLSTPIVLDDMSTPPRSPGTAAVSWTGSALRLTWADSEAMPVGGVWVERRDASTGALLSGPTRQAGVSSNRYLWGGADQAYAPSTDHLLFAAYTPNAWPAVLIDPAGAPVVDATVSNSCNGFHQHIGVYDVGTRFVTAAVQESCASPTRPTLRVTPVAYDGTAGTPHLELTPSRLGLGSAYDPGTRQMLLLYTGITAGYRDLRGRLLDVDAFTAMDEVVITRDRSVDQIRGGFDGQRFGVLYGTYGGSGNWTARFRTYEPGATPGAATTLFSGRNRRFAQARVHGSADGWTILMTTIDSASTSLAPSASADPEVWLYRLAPDGALREAVQIDADQRLARFVDLAWAGGRMALTWVRQDMMTGRTWHMLSLMECAP